jgi:hypothetical protein
MASGTILGPLASRASESGSRFNGEGALSGYSHSIVAGGFDEMS